MFQLCKCIIGRVPEVGETLIPLTRVVFDSVIKDAVCHIEVTQTFRNVENNPIECEYVFPLMEDGALSHMTVQTDDGKVLEAVVEDLGEAKERYSDAISEGNQAVLGRMETEDRMVLNIGNMAPKSKVEVKFTVVQPVKCEGKEWLFLLPAALLPLYNLGKSLEEFGLQGEVEPAHLVLVTPYQCTYKFHFHLHITSSSEITSIQCKSHPVLITKNENGKEATVTTDPHVSFAPNKDFRVTYETIDSMVPHVHVQYDPKTQEYAGMLSFIPPLLDAGEELEDLTGIGEFILLLDRSGSMQGGKIEMAKEAVLLFIKSLSPGCKFNVISFGTNYELLFKRSVTYNTESVEYAIKKIATFQADMNGTNILNPIAEAFQTIPDLQYPRSIFLLTDGAVSNPDAVVDFVEANSKLARVHAFGIGDGVSTSLVNNVARAGNGVAEFISNPADIKSKVISVLQKTLAPALLDNELHWSSETISQYPSNDRIPTFYFGEVFRTLVLFGQVPPSPGSIVLLTSQSSKTNTSMTFDIPIGPELSEGEDIHKLWAKQAIKEMQFTYRRSQDPNLKNRIVEISKQRSVPSLYTAFLCVESRPDPVTGVLQLRKVPIASRLGGLNSGRSGFPGSFSGAGRGRGMMLMLCKTKKKKVQKKEIDSGFRDLAQPESATISTSTSSAIESAKAALLHSEILPYVESQDIDGHWSLQSLPKSLLGLPAPPDFEQRFGPETSEVWATICVLLLLQIRYKNEEGEWRLIGLKAKRWLKSHGIADLSLFTEHITTALNQYTQ